MTVFVLREGKLVPKGWRPPAPGGAGNFPSPRVSRFEAMESPVTGKEITSWRERERDMAAVDCIDRRDLPKDFVFKKGRNNGRA
jgi:hypothetical protein